MRCSKCEKSIPLGDSLKLLCKQWEGILDFYGAPREMFHWEAAQLGRAIQSYGAEAVNLALLGAKAERSSRDFNPAEYLSLSRILDRQKVERFITLGARYKKKLLDARSKRGEI